VLLLQSWNYFSHFYEKKQVYTALETKEEHHSGVIKAISGGTEWFKW
jgi:uncharacterized protein (UPF0332 family)